MLAIFPLFAITCTDQKNGDQNATVKIDFGGADMMASLSGISDIQKSGTPSVLPVDISTIEIKVTSGTEVVFDEIFDRNVIANSSDSITLDIPTGTARVFTVYARDDFNVLRYTSNSVQVDLLPGVDSTVSLILGTDSAVQNVNLTVNLRNQGDTGAYVDPTYLGNTAGYMIRAEIFKPTVATGLGTAISTQSTSSFTNNLSGLLAYSNTYQLVIVRAMSTGANSTIAAIGAAIISNLASGSSSSVNIRMIPPGRINVTYTGGAISTVTAQMNFGAGLVTVAPSGVITGNTAVILVPNCVQNIGTGQTVYSRPVRITINGSITKDVTFDSTTPLKWQAVNVTVP